MAKPNPLTRSIRMKLSVGTVAIVLAVVCILTFVIARNAANLLGKASNDQLAQLLHQSTAMLSNFIAVREANLDLWVTHPLVHAVVNDPALGAVFLPGLRNYFADYTAKEPWIENIYLVKDDTVVYAHAETWLFPKEAATTRAGAKRLLALPPSGLAVLHLSALQPGFDRSVIVMKRQLVEEGNPLEGRFLLLLLDLETLQQKLFGPIQVGQHGFLALVATPSWEGPDALWIPRQATGNPERADFVAARQQGLVLTDHPTRYNTIVLDHRTLADSPLAIVGVAALRDVREPVIDLMYYSVGFGLATLCIGIIGTFFFAGRLTAPISALTTRARQFAAGELRQETHTAPPGAAPPQAPAGVAVTAHTHRAAFVQIQSQDEIGELASAFNQMAHDIGRFIDELEYRNALSRAVIGTRDLEAILATIVQVVAQSGGYDSVRLYLYDESQQGLVCRAAFGIDPAQVAQLTLSLTGESHSVLASVFAKQQTAVVEDAAQDAQGTPDLPAGLGIASYAAVPLVGGKKALGVLAADYGMRQLLPPEHLNLLSALASTAALAIENSLFYNDLEDYSRMLEQRVAERTAELAEANAEITALNTRLQAENLRLGAELDVTRKLQQMLRPTQEELQQIDGLDIACYMAPADEVGGDYYDILQHNGQIKIGIGDVTGHGLESGVLMLMTQAIVRALLINGETDPVRFLDTVNRVLYSNVRRMGTDKNLTLALLDYAAGEVRLSGQHEEMLVVRQDGSIERVETVDLGFPIGLVDEIAGYIQHRTVVLQPGDGVVLYTDGITEAENVAGEQYGLVRLCAAVCQHWGQAADTIKEAVVADVQRHIGGHQVYDDLTLVVVKQQ
jgi:serine phosphatase RsbU (regulator of sigma subunit)/HAMP domain-containing protein